MHGTAEAPDLVPCFQASLAHAKEIAAACEAEGIRAELGRDPCCGGGCAPKVMVLVQPADLPRVADLMQRRFAAMVAQDGGQIHGASEDAEHPPCPACGTAAPLTGEGACADCGLVLA